MPQRIVLCRPQGGLNDMLCQIEKCCQYAEKTRRTVIIDTAYQNTDYFRDKFGNYFKAKQNRLILSPNDQACYMDDLPVYPVALQGRLNSYEAKFDRTTKAFRDSETGQATSFDFNQDHPYPVLVHHQAGGGSLSQFALLRLTLNRSLVNELIERINRINGPWVGVHVRNTDYTTNYDSLLAQLKQERFKRIFLATDSLNVREHFQNELKNSVIYSFSKRLSVDGKPLHKIPRVDDSEIFTSNCDAILDLIMLALSSRLLFKKIEPNAFGTSNSGYAILAQNLWKNKIILKYLISDQRFDFGLG